MKGYLTSSLRAKCVCMLEVRRLNGYYVRDKCSSQGSLPRAHQVFHCQSWAGKTREKDTGQKHGTQWLAQWAMLIVFTSLTLMHQTPSIRVENDTMCHNKNQDVKPVIMPLWRTSAPPQNPQVISFHLLLPLSHPAVTAFSLPHALKLCLWVDLDTVWSSNQPNEFKIHFSLQSIKRNIICLAFSPCFWLTEMYGWWRNSGFYFYLFIYKFY